MLQTMYVIIVLMYLYNSIKDFHKYIEKKESAVRYLKENWVTILVYNLAIIVGIVGIGQEFYVVNVIIVWIYFILLLTYFIVVEKARYGVEKFTIGEVTVVDVLVYLGLIVLLFVSGIVGGVIASLITF